MVSDAIDHCSLEDWKPKRSKTSRDRARDRVNRLMAEYEPAPLEDGLRGDLEEIALSAGRRFGLD